MKYLARLRRAWWGIRHEIRWGQRHLVSGRASYFVNVLAYRWLSVSKRASRSTTTYRLQTRSGVVVHYRRDRGDIQGIREIFIDEIYRLPDGAAPTSLVDLGANIGVATVWLCHEYSLREFCAVEPMGPNFALLEANCRANGLEGHLLNVAVGTTSGSANFDVDAGSNMGRLGGGSSVVEVIAIDQLLAELRFAPNLLKMDIEGGEKALLTEIDPAWIAAFSLIVMEMHPQYFDIGPLIETIIATGFTYFAPIESHVGTLRSKRERLFVKSPTSLTR